MGKKYLFRLTIEKGEFSPSDNPDEVVCDAFLVGMYKEREEEFFYYWGGMQSAFSLLCFWAFNLGSVILEQKFPKDNRLTRKVKESMIASARDFVKFMHQGMQIYSDMTKRIPVSENHQTQEEYKFSVN